MADQDIFEFAENVPFRGSIRELFSAHGHYDVRKVRRALRHEYRRSQLFGDRERSAKLRRIGRKIGIPL